MKWICTLMASSFTPRTVSDFPSSPVQIYLRLPFQRRRHEHQSAWSFKNLAIVKTTSPFPIWQGADKVLITKYYEKFTYKSILGIFGIEEESWKCRKWIMTKKTTTEKEKQHERDGLLPCSEWKYVIINIAFYKEKRDNVSWDYIIIRTVNRITFDSEMNLVDESLVCVIFSIYMLNIFGSSRLFFNNFAL